MKAILFILLFGASIAASAQDSLIIDQKSDIRIKGRVEKTVDSTYKPRTAILRSAMVPGWGQITNKKYWKLPLVWGSLGTTAYVFAWNLNYYKKAKLAYRLSTDDDPSNDSQVPADFSKLISNPERINQYKREFRQNVDYSVLFFIGFWALNVADAAVDAHLKTFDVSDDLSLKIKAGVSPMAGTVGVSMILQIGK